MSTILHNEAETAQYAAKIAEGLSAPKLLFLRGNLGAGKTVFARALVRSLTGDQDLEVPSPTFTLVQYYDSPKGPIYHFDLYRLEDPEEIYELGWEEALHAGIVIVEWPERLGALTPSTALDIRIQTLDNEPDKRKIEVNDHGSGD